MRQHSLSQKIKTGQNHTSCPISTKNFDGDLLYGLFLASRRLKKQATSVIKPKQMKVQRPSKTSSYCLSPAKIKQVRPEKPGPLMMKITTQQTKPSSEKFFNSFNNYLDGGIVKFSTEARTASYNNVAPHGTQIQKIHDSIMRNSICLKYYDSIQYKRKEQVKTSIGTRSRIQSHKNYTPTIRTRKAKCKSPLKLQQFVKAQMFKAESAMNEKMNDISASSITVIRSNKRIYQIEGNQVRQIASLTKIMTCVVCLFLVKKHSIDIYEQKVKVSRQAADIPGTSAELKNGDSLTINDLLYAMMLPSGNDAAYALAQYFHKFIHKVSSPKKTVELVSQNKRICIQSCEPGYMNFVKEMNRCAVHLKMNKSKFNNPHGLSDQNNVSTSNDMAELCYYAMKNQFFRTIVSTKIYQTKVYNTHQKMFRIAQWNNTNKLLDLQNCLGIKTGITPAAGPCMSACFQQQGNQIIIVILGTKNKISRFQEVKRLYQWAKMHTQ